MFAFVGLMDIRAKKRRIGGERQRPHHLLTPERRTERIRFCRCSSKGIGHMWPSARANSNLHLDPNVSQTSARAEGKSSACKESVRTKKPDRAMRSLPA